jgi:photosystem II stability/assembly factor-like uncharacterized protein
MSIRSTLVPVLLAAVPVIAAFVGGRAPEPPPPSSLPVTWSAATLDAGDVALATAQLWDVTFPPDGTGLAAGTQNRNWLTEDAGRSWRPLPGKTLVSADGGVSWSAENAGTRAHLRSVAFAPDGSAVAVGCLGTIVHRTSGAEARR